MNLEGTIAVGVDGSSHAARALAWAGRQAALTDRSLTVVAVGKDAPELADAAAREAREQHAAVGVQPMPGSGDPREVLLDVAEHAHLVVVGSRGRGTLKTLVLGSVSAAVAGGATCPVVVCRPGDEHPARGVVVGADGTAESAPVVEFAYEQAALLGLPLTVLHGFWDASVAVAEHRRSKGEQVEDPDLEDLRALLSASVAGLSQTYPDVPVTLALRHGFVEEALAPRRGAPELVVVGRHPERSATRLLEASVSRLVLERSRSTVAVVPEAAPTRPSGR